MLKVNYPKDRKAFEEAYWSIFKDLKIKKDCVSIIKEKLKNFETTLFLSELNKRINRIDEIILEVKCSNPKKSTKNNKSTNCNKCTKCKDRTVLNKEFDENNLLLSEAFMIFLIENPDIKTIIENQSKKSDHEELFRYVLTAPFEALHEILHKIDKEKIKWNKSDLVKIFFYGGQNLSSEKTENDNKAVKNEKAYISAQSGNIAPFFRHHLGISTCYYCNIDYVNSFNIGDYLNKLDYFMNVGAEEIKPHIKGIRNAFFKFRDELKQNKTQIKSLDELIKGMENYNGIGSKTRKKFKTLNLESALNEKVSSQFTLDHLINKADYPLLALSLYNLVPSCYTCNSKLKGDQKLIDIENEKGYEHSPTYHNFNTNTVKFELLFENEQKSSNYIEIMNLEYDKKGEIISKFKIKITSDTKYNEIFRLEGRYAYHKREVEELIEKKKRYPKIHQDNIIRIFENSRLISTLHPKKLKQDIFGKEIFDDDNENSTNSKTKPFTKLKRDISKQIGLLNSAHSKNV